MTSKKSQTEVIKYKNIKYNITHPDVYYNCFLNKYVHKNSSHNRGLTFGIINIDESGTFVMGFFKKDIYNCVRVVHGQATHITNNIDTFLSNNDYSWDQSREYFIYNPGGSKVINVVSRRTEERAYNIEENSDYNQIIELYNSYKIKIDSNTYKYKELLKNYTFGFEIESSSGRVFPWTKHKFGFTECRDGSISNAEYVSVPMSGLKGIQSLINFCNENKKYVQTDSNCSLHIHVGNIRTDKWFIVALYNCLYNLQNDYYEYFPYYKKDNTVIGKSKHYTKALLPLSNTIYDLNNKEETIEKLDSNLKNIFTFLTDGIEPNTRFNRKNRTHPKREKWNINNRYYLFNFVNLLFGNRKTLEFRIHENTFNSEKIVNHLILSLAIINYVENNIYACLTGKSLDTIVEILDTYVKDDALYEDLILYYESRRKLFASKKSGTFDEYCNK